MGKAKIISGGTGGLYNIELVRNTAKIIAAIDTIAARLILLAPAIASALIAKNAAAAVLSAKRAALDEAIGKFILSQITSADVSAAQKEYLAALTAYQDKSVAYSSLLQEQESKSKSKTLLQAALSPEYRNNIWCADLTENLPSGEEVGTIEVNGEKTQIIIYPGGDWDSLPESVLQPVLASSSAGAFYNQAILPGWQKWKPTYRIGTVTAISGDLCTVSLVATFSSQQRLNINMIPGTISLNNVPIEYMDGLNGSVFVVGDRVVIEFTDQDWSKPKVIGFETNPRNNIYYFISNFDGVSGDTDWPVEHPALPDLARYYGLSYPADSPILTDAEKKFGNTSANFGIPVLHQFLEYKWSATIIKDFTLEMWVMFKGVWPSADAHRSINMDLYGSGSGSLVEFTAQPIDNILINQWQVASTSGYLPYIREPFIFARNLWQHLAFICRDKALMIALQGTIIHTFDTGIINPFADLDTLIFSSQSAIASSDEFLIDALSFVAGAKWTANFTPPTTAPHV